jgi:hypothetical protein
VPLSLDLANPSHETIEIERLRTERDQLATLFSAIWDNFLDGSGLDGFQLQDLLENSGLAAWRDATEEDVLRSHMEIEIGDPLLFLTETGKRLVQLGKEPDVKAADAG